MAMSSNVVGSASSYRRSPASGHAPYWQDSQMGEARSPAASPEASFLQRVLSRSFLEFKSTALESAYQRYLSKQAGAYLLAFTPIALLTGGQMVYHAAADGSFRRLNFPPGFLITILLFVLPTIGLILFICTQQPVYAKHWRGINAAYTGVLVLSTNGFQRLCLWQRSRSGTRSGSVHAFAIENFFLTVIGLRNTLYPAGQAPDLFFTTVSFLLSMAGNQSLCGWELWGLDRVTLSPLISSIPRKASVFLPAFWGYQISTVPRNGTPLSCPALLTFWQLVGWVLACLAIIVHEILSRRAFLKAHSAVYGRAASAGAQAWPLRDLVLTHKLLFAVLLVFFSANIVWAVAVEALQ
eukprot:jgi/Botrbrau1/8408/Bobra.0237s0029.1